MEQHIIQLYPQPGDKQPLKGTYLAHNLRRFAGTDQAYVYANFIASLDNRIAISQDGGNGMRIPQSITNDRDWWLFQELACQADIIITSGRYLREWAQGNAQEILQTDDPRFAELRDWRLAQGLPPQTDIAIISNNLNFPVPDVLTAGGRKTFVFTTADTKPDKARAIEKKGIPVIVAGGQTGVNGAAMIDYLTKRGYRLIFSSAGPKILHLLIASRMLNRLYLTHACQILGGEYYAGIIEGKLLEPAADFNLNSLYLDPAGPGGQSQLFYAFDRQ
ncbi:Pyrimidine reductase, riboflavin biosynthesis [Nitrosomonas sp. Nm51]|uniref:RibD family protein n=1 Tax=Nitrosomonas sp. Nm51 TaxID=133720 RepID=UPI0008C27D06|nr:dihydrofolate reductase family protein [Nitrosomonas sp. Nm51]SER40133.1 Pyrimidine reductase, riboflavin biosynthesis [Nitrosomonas sp. Nm51]